MEQAVRLDVRPLGYSLGAEISGIDLRRDDGGETIALLRRLLLSHIVICIRGQQMEPEDLERFASCFGTVDRNEGIKGTLHPDRSAVRVLVNKPMTVAGKAYRGQVTDFWHSDLSFRERPSTFSFLNAKVIPPVGGDTMFANMYAAYDALSPAYRAIIDPLSGVYDIRISIPYFDRRPADERASLLADNPPVVHRVVTTHAETGRKALYASDRIRMFEGMTEEETQPVLDFLCRHAVRHEFVYRHRWQQHDLVVWDNRCAMHYAIPDYDPDSERVMIRCSTEGEATGRLYDQPLP